MSQILDKYTIKTKLQLVFQSLIAKKVCQVLYLPTGFCLHLYSCQKQKYDTNGFSLYEFYSCHKLLFLEPEAPTEMEVPEKVSEQVPIEEGFGDIFNKQSSPPPTESEPDCAEASIDQGM